MSQTGGSELKLESLLDPTERYELGECIARGVYADVYEAKDIQAGGKRVAVKVQKVNSETEQDFREEYRILRDLSSHPNLPEFYGVYLKKAAYKNDEDELWFVMELCQGGPVTDLVQGMDRKNKRMPEEHIAYILKETIKALVYLHENHVMHRNVKGSNILLTKEGDVKLVDFGLAREVNSTLGKRSTCLGSPCWMAPEVVTSMQKSDSAYDNRADVWALGITAIELGEGRPPFEDMHPTRALFQIVRNPPPGLTRPANWSQDYNDFIAECLEKNPEHRPYMMELVEHPFILSLPENDHYLSQELKLLASDSKPPVRLIEPAVEPEVRTGYLKSKQGEDPEPMHVEDLAALDNLTEDTILAELYERHRLKHCHTFVGDVLLVLNPNEDQDIYKDKHHTKYQFKSRAQNEPHIFAVADRAYQDMLHHEEPQHILLAGESLSGKTTNMVHLLNHLLFMGRSGNGAADKVKKGLKIVQALGNASTPLNPNSTRHIMQLQVTFSSTGKVSGGIFWLYQLEKWRVTTTEREQGNFHFFYYFYDAMEAKGCLNKFKLEAGRGYRYLRCKGNGAGSGAARESPENNVIKFHEIQQYLTDLDFEEDKITTLYNMVAAILVLGEVEFKDPGDGQVEVANPELAANVSQLLEVDDKKFQWSLLNYCLVQKGTAVRKRHTLLEAVEARDVLARGLYQRLLDWVVNVINFKLSFSRIMFGDFHVANLLDMFGFECFPGNSLEQLLVNTMNEQMQFHYNQRVFAWEMQEQQEEEVPFQSLQYHDNRPTLDALLKKPEGLMYVLDDASRQCEDQHFIMNYLRNSSTSKPAHLRPVGDHEFTIAHYTGSVTYDSREMPDKNHDFLPPEMIETLRLSHNLVVKKLFTNQFAKCGTLTFTQEPTPAATPTTPGIETKRGRWGAALFAEHRTRARKYNTESHGQYSQLRGMRTATATFRATSLEVLRGLAVGPSSGGTHFVRCLRTDLTGNPWGFQSDLIRQQLKALAVVDTAHARQKGYPHRVPFPEFIRRYQFLAFDFDENVEVTKENSRLLLVRLKMEGWLIGKSKVFLKYYNEEYLSMKYEVQVKKIVKVQTMMRAFLAKRNVASKLKRLQSIKSEDRPDEEKRDTQKKAENMTEDEAAIMIQKEFRGFQVRKHIRPLLQPTPVKWDENMCDFMRQYCKRWKAKTVFQVLLFYRAARHQDLVYFSQQVHLFNQSSVAALSTSHQSVNLDRVDPGGRSSLAMGKRRQTVMKIPFRLRDMPYFDTAYMCDPLGMTGTGPSNFDDDYEAWDAPLRRHNTIPQTNIMSVRDQETQTTVEVQASAESDSFPKEPYTREPNDGKMAVSKKASPYQHHAPQPYSARKNVTPHAVNFNTQEDRPAEPAKKTQREEHDSDWDFPRHTSPKKDMNQAKNEYNRQGLAYPGPKPLPRGPKNPIVEMEMKGKQKQDETNVNDNPPFNFQAMLRKTNNKRASLRRCYDIDNSSSEKEVTSSIDKFKKNDMNTNNSFMPLNNANKEKHKPLTASAESQKSPNKEKLDNKQRAMITTEQLDNEKDKAAKEQPENEKYKVVRKSSGNKGKVKGMNIQPWSPTNEKKEITTTELVPGLMIQGQVADL